MRPFGIRGHSITTVDKMRRDGVKKLGTGRGQQFLTLVDTVTYVTTYEYRNTIASAMGSLTYHHDKTNDTSP